MFIPTSVSLIVLAAGKSNRGFRGRHQAAISAIPGRADGETTSFAAWHIAASRSCSARSPRRKLMSPAIAAEVRERRSPSSPAGRDRGQAPQAVLTSSRAPRSSMRSNRRFDPLDKGRAVRLDDEEPRAVAVDQRPAARRLPFEDGAAGCVQHLQRPHDALAVGRLQLHGDRRILVHQDAVQLGRALAPSARSASGRAPAAECRAFPKCPRQARENRARCRRRKSPAVQGAPSAAGQACRHRSASSRRAARRRWNRRWRDARGRRENAARGRVRQQPAAPSARRAPNSPAWNRC